MEQEKMQIDPSIGRAFLHEITKGWADLPEPAMVELRCLFPGRTPLVSRYSPDETGLDMLLSDAEGMNKHGVNTYIVVNPVRKSAPLFRRDANGKDRQSGALDEDIIAAFFFWADGDDEEAANSIRNFAGPKYTMAVTTGTVPSPRPHIYWRIQDGPTFDLETWTTIQKGIAAVLSTDRTVVNPARIMRLPGFINWPTEQKKAKGRVAELSTFRAKYDDNREPVPFEQMHRAFAGAAPKPKAATEGAAFQIDTGGEFSGKSSAEYADILRRARTDGEKHSGVRDLTASLAGMGVSRAMTEAIVREACPVWDEGVEKLITSAYEKYYRPKPDFAPNFDHAPAPTASDPNPAVAGWKVQTAADFTADFVAPEYIIDGIVQRGRIYTLTAPTGSGKTAAMLYASVSIATGMQFCGHEVEAGDVLFMAGENPDDVRARVIATLEFYKIDPRQCRLHFIAGTFSIRADMDKLREEAAKLPDLKLVVIDTFAAYFDGDDENSNAQALDFARLVRKIAAFPAKPAVIMPAHPVKNATRSNLTPKGGSSLLNEVDGNLTLWNDGGIISMHWQGKFRGAEFEPMSMELQRHESSLICDADGRLIPTILAKPLAGLRAAQLAKENLTLEDKLLISIRDYPAISLEQRGTDIGRVHKMKVKRTLEKMAEQRLVRKFRTNWELTKEGERALEIIENGGGFVPEIDT